MPACPQCGKKIRGDYLVWKGGINRARCPGCAREEQEQQKKVDEREKDR